MLDNLDNITLIESVSADNIGDLSSKYDALLPFYSVRTNNVLSSLQEKYASKSAFLSDFIRMSSKEFAGLKNCGRKTVKEIEAIQESLITTRIMYNPGESEFIPHEYSQEPDPIPPTLPENIDTLLPLVIPRLKDLSVRAKNGFIIFLEENHGSLAELYTSITNPKFNPVKMKNVGRNTEAEIGGFLKSIKEYLESFPDKQSVEETVTRFFSKNLDDLQIPLESQEGIREKEKSLGRFPLFAALKTYFEGLEGEDRSILDGLFIIHEDQIPRNRDEIAAELGLSSERVRQKRNRLVDTLAEYFASYRIHGFMDKCPYNYQMRRINEEINAEEGTDFNLNFINWVLASTFEEVTLLGDVIKSITGYYEKNYFLCLVPTDLCQYMDFNAFLEDIETRLAEKRINEEKVNLQSLINGHLKTQYCEEEKPAIETACRSILYLHFPVDVDFGQVILKPNARKNNPVIAEEILRAAGHPLTLEEIYEEFIYQYPERYTEMHSFRGAIQSNRNIIPISRTSTYTLAEWEGDTIRGGSIRQIIADYLRTLDPTIAPISDITEHVCQFRPTTDEYNILTNLSLERSGMFSFFFREGIRYIGLSENSYPIEFFPYSGDARNAFAMSIGYPKLMAFISKNGHFPFTSGVDEEERQLCGFWRRQQRYYNAGELSASGLAYHTMILERYGHLQMDKKEYDWRKKYDLVHRAFVEGELSAFEQEEQSRISQLLSDMIHDYKYFGDSMPEWKKGAMKELLNKITEISNVQDNLG